MLHRRQRAEKKAEKAETKAAAKKAKDEKQSTAKKTREETQAAAKKAKGEKNRNLAKKARAKDEKKAAAKKAREEKKAVAKKEKVTSITMCCQQYQEHHQHGPQEMPIVVTMDDAMLGIFGPLREGRCQVIAKDELGLIMSATLEDGGVAGTVATMMSMASLSHFYSRYLEIHAIGGGVPSFKTNLAASNAMCCIWEVYLEPAQI